MYASLNAMERSVEMTAVAVLVATARMGLSVRAALASTLASHLARARAAAMMAAEAVVVSARTAIFASKDNALSFASHPAKESPVAETVVEAVVGNALKKSSARGHSLVFHSARRTVQTSHAVEMAAVGVVVPAVRALSARGEPASRLRA